MDEVIVGVEGALGRITLNRPRAINALTLPMVRAIDAALAGWERDPRVRAVLLDGAGERGFCAGGDIVALRRSALDGDGFAERFWREEYHLNARIAASSKPVVVLMDGVVMGGGVGLSGHARHRVATERLTWAMPETMIGFAPDVGGTFLLSRAPGQLGTHIGLTAARIGAGDALACGFADRFVAAAELEQLVADLRDGDPAAAIDAATQRSGPPPAAALASEREAIDACYAGDDAEQIAARLLVAGREEPLAALSAASPTSVKVTLAALRRAAGLRTLEACLEAELRTSCGLLGTADFAEGIRAMVVDKDRQPAWSPPTLAEVEDADAARIARGPEGLGGLWAQPAPAGAALMRSRRRTRR
ncbi:enoyl-CoA hydratase/isomerase family protein [Conexibacter sp. CPCC 206217]|uniref:enoyl-CoA hydratase/isomerase family protein n=1 Tax=Conexibacter sp. CPCC 206217 TaxID=3064574 RepID=UPI00272568EC|nr:enoyl-CoA hydratase/isomerase family protein [Conexibacter sp. CPCC 206217]MDO8209614.1 enoyl-CoA hydratase/isomerase family protein [Conexibacter sp. CPCC 206217]